MSVVRKIAIFASAIGFALSVTLVEVVRAEENATIDVTISTTDAGSFSVSVQAVDETTSFGTVSLNAVNDATVSQTFILTYSDTSTQRGEGAVMVSISSFEPLDPIAPFTGSDQVHFQIPNRYLTLANVGDVVPGNTPPACSPPIGTISADASHETSTFDNGAPLNVSSVESGCGVGSATQPITIDLTVPAGVYPATYQATMTIETTVS